jgi:PcfJ-like protein
MAKAYQTAIRKHSLIMRKHMDLVGGVWRYRDWCKANGFAENFDKTAKQIASEHDCIMQHRRKLDANARLHHNPKKLLEEICLGKLHSRHIERPQWKALALEIEASRLNHKDAKTLLEFCLYILGVADFLLDDTMVAGQRVSYLAGIIKLHALKQHWLRKLEDWRPPCHNSDRQFHSLARHLLARYDLPAFFDQVWFFSGEPYEKHRDWFVHVGVGSNMRNAATPVPLTKMMAHHMMLAPDHSTMEGAIRWGQIHALGGDSALAEAILGTRLATHFSEDEFWLSVFRFFIDNPMLDRHHIGPIIDYLHHQKFETRNILEADNRVVNLPPAQPNLTMQGRTVEALLTQMEKWHRALNKETKLNGDIFKLSGFEGFRMETRDEDVWIISELRSTLQLRNEGQKMRHCVLSYARSCISGDNSIWAMELQSKDGLEKKQTIQVTKMGQIVQCRGKLNRLPTPGEFSMLERWSRQAGLTISAHVKVAS